MDSKIVLLRRILQEIRRSNVGNKVNNSPIASYIMQQYRKYQVTDMQLCKAQAEMDFLARTYLSYMESIRKMGEINDTYHAKGEKTIRQTADMVGFKLPHDPK